MLKKYHTFKVANAVSTFSRNRGILAITIIVIPAEEYRVNKATVCHEAISAVKSASTVKTSINVVDFYRLCPIKHESIYSS